MAANVPVSLLQGGSVLNVASSGTLLVAAGGSIQNSGGMSAANLSATTFGATALTATNGTFGSIRATDGTFAGTISIGGTAGRWAFGSATLTSGTSQIYTGLAQIVSAHVHPIGASPGTGAGTATSFSIEPSRFANGSIIALGLIGTFNFGGAGTVLWTAFGF